ncbi:hypothetical protein F0M18_09060 [Pseudohalioglobus sediminis]|uniref:YhdP central domain-containing protein n=1 Tax=Pseudohalioglobus sediminis TaxID=2606449 RepID=A0A5B0X0E1_9GAMM|nr:AsmA-like C-terminal region-containing protein [Pseudohalioglobus sediminis]KAA1192792.1 hypothetical protein F0M18_09060 [Pseudohalioglobus sediminis]
MQRSIFHRLSNVLWVCVVAAIVLLATYVSLGRVLSTNLHNWQDVVLSEINSRVPFAVTARNLSGEWSSFTPEIVLHDLEFDMLDGTSRPLQLTGGRIGIDVLGSLANRSLQITSLRLDGLALEGELTADGKLLIPGISGGGGTLGEWLQQFLLNIEYVTLEDNRLQLRLPGGQLRQYDLALHLARDGSQRHMRAELLATTGTAISVVGKGLGNPFRPAEFEGTLFMEIESADLDAIAELFAEPPSVWAGGELASKLWLFWDRGKVEVDVDLALSNAVLQPLDGSWSLPLDELSLQATLVQRRKRWTAYASDLLIAHAGTELAVPRLQVDAWGDSLRLRTAALQLQPLNQLLLDTPAVPEALRSVFQILNMRGEVSAMQLAVGDRADPLAGWDVEGNFDALQVDSWRGAPGVTSGTGYFELSDNGGYVVLDSQQFALDFPTVYRDPLFYEDFYGTLNLDWDEHSLLLHSDLITARGAEGKAEALFSLNIPFTATDTGLEMDLLVGLADSHPRYRMKYLPYILNAGLLDWLGSAVGEGRVEQAGFVWRGTLRSGASDLRTVQLMLNLEDTALAYHPDWPAVSNFDGTVLIDDTNVSVWADSAQVYESSVTHLSAESWMDDDAQMRLAIDGRISGSAADGLRVVNESLLGDLTGAAFARWQAAGDLETHLQLELNLADPSAPPEVDVAVELGDVALLIEQGRLPLQQLAGQIGYSSAQGFSSKELRATLWQEEVTAALRQRNLRGQDAAFAMADSALEVSFQSRVSSGALSEWLQLQALELADGTAEVNGLVTVIPGEIPLLTLSSDLAGMALDLPPPWTKLPASTLPLEIALPLGGERPVLGMALGEDISLHLHIDNGQLRAAGLGLEAPPPELQPGSVLVQGRAPLVDAQAWLDFSNRYLLGREEAQQELAADNSTDASGEFTLGITGIYTERLLLWGREIADVDFSLQLERDLLTVTAATDWLHGSYRQPQQGVASLEIDFLDITPPGGEDTSPGEAEAPGAPDDGLGGLTLPLIEASISELRMNGEAVGSLAFTLAAADGALSMLDITGEVAGLSLMPESPGELSWQPEHGSRARLPLEFEDIGNTLERLGYARFVETDQGTLALDLQWDGSPEAFALASLGGRLDIALGKGRFLQTPGGAGALQVVEIVNLAGIVERLSLSHMFESGLNFDAVTGEVFFHQGKIEVAGLDVRSTSSAFSMSGVSDIASRSLDGELVATLPVANNLPWVAALTAGPAVAAGVFVVSKVFEKQVNRLSSGVYTIEGTWDEPDVSFDRIFDDEVRQVSVPAAPLADPNDPAEKGLAPGSAVSGRGAVGGGLATDAEGATAEPVQPSP